MAFIAATTLAARRLRERGAGFETWRTWFGALRMEALTALGRIDEALAESARQAARSARNGERLFERQHRLLRPPGLFDPGVAPRNGDRGLFEWI